MKVERIKYLFGGTGVSLMFIGISALDSNAPYCFVACMVAILGALICLATSRGFE